MSYRDDVDAARARTEALGRELVELEARLGDRAELEARAAAVRAQLVTARAQVAQARARGTLPLLDRVVIKTPCKQAWSDMVGDEQKRFCGQCQKHVYDLSAMTAAEAEALLGGSAAAPCVRLYRRPDGTVMTSDCPDGARRRTRGRLAIAGVALAAAAAGLGGTVRWRASDEAKPVATEHEAIMGKMEPVMGGSAMSDEQMHRIEAAEHAAETGVEPTTAPR